MLKTTVDKDVMESEKSSESDRENLYSIKATLYLNINLATFS